MPSGFEKSLSPRSIEAYFDIIKKKQAGTLNAMLEPQFVSCNETARELTLRFTVQPWQKNPEGHLHGGILAAMFDFTMGLLSCFVHAGPLTPTINLNINFLSVLKDGDDLIICAKCDKHGRTLSFVSGAAWGESDENKRIATATASFFCA